VDDGEGRLDSEAASDASADGDGDGVVAPTPGCRLLRRRTAAIVPTTSAAITAAAIAKTCRLGVRDPTSGGTAGPPVCMRLTMSAAEGSVNSVVAFRRFPSHAGE